MDHVPVLRADLSRVVSEDGLLEALHDPILGRRINLGSVSRSLVDKIDGKKTCAELLDEVLREQPERTRELVEHTFRTLLLMNLTVGSGTGILEKVQALKEGDASFEPVTLPGSRFACQGSGQCCHNYQFGPLAQKDIDRLAELDLGAAFPDIGSEPYVTELVGDDGQVERFLRSIDKRCVFLLKDRRCGIHAHFGVEHKPRMCRVFPLQDIPTMLGWKIYDRGECATFAVSARSGPLLADDLERIEGILERPDELYHPLVFLDQNTPCDYGYFLHLQEALASMALRGATAASSAHMVLSMGRMVRAFTSELMTCPLEAGEPERSLNRVLCRPRESFYEKAPPGLASEGLRALVQVTDHLLAVAAPRLFALAGTKESYIPVRQLDHFLIILHTMKTLALSRLDAGPMGDALYQRIDEACTDASELEEAMRISLANQAWGLRMLISGQLVPAMLRIAIMYLFTLVGSKLLAAQDGLGQVRPADLSYAHKLAQRAFIRDYLTDVFIEEQGRTWQVLEAVPALLAPPGPTA